MYAKMLQYVKEYLENSGGEITKFRQVSFRKRSEHCRRVYMWAQRLVCGIDNINKEVVLTAAVFHDVGYGDSLDRSNHAENSAVICEKYLKENEYNDEFISHVVYLVRNHSRKELMAMGDTPLELILLMEADLLDETGALSVVWDCMMEGSQEVQSFEKSYEHIIQYSVKTIQKNPMVTVKAKNFWENKQKLMKEFVEQLSFDLGIN